MEQISLFDMIEGGEQYKPIKSNDWKWKFSDYPKEKNGLKVFSCFACGGGSTMGYKLAGCDVIGCCEIDKKMNEVYVANHHPKHNFLMDIRDFNNLEDLPSDLYDLDILDGSPPCTTFSMSGDREDSWGKKKKFREGQKEQTLDDLSFVFIDTVKKLMPKVVIMENVEGITLGEAWKYVQRIYEKFNLVGYDVHHWLLKGEDMGVPQKRHRCFFVATRKDLQIKPMSLNMRFNYLPITYGEIKDGQGPEVTPETKLLLIEAREDETLLSAAWNRLYGNGKYKKTRFNSVLNHNRNVMATITAGHCCAFDYENKKYVSKNDMIHSQTFPEDFDFFRESYAMVSYVCGMSVPPVMIKRIVTRLIEEGVFDYKTK